MSKEPIYTCPMHPEIQSDLLGSCPKCKMKLVEIDVDSDEVIV
ncbi:heavy metal-binding domain-containing protein [Pedobacter gandavensis]|nr:heavy metal-binding domain-containing protein [Pedobacter gandavensis]WGQ08937.1 heavy metal-binding domain-containing protein [Pedobacter gandavensis]